MSQTRIHESLLELFEHKDKNLISILLNHPNYLEFAGSIEASNSSHELSSAFIHSSFAHEFGVKDQEILEFLGDSVLQLVITEKLISLHPILTEGKLSKMRSFLVNEASLSRLAKFLGLSELILLGKGEYVKKTHTQDAVLADSFEALLGVLYKNEGLDFCRNFILKVFLATNPAAFEIENLESYDAKSKLQEHSLKLYKKLPTYKSTQKGEEFLVELFINDKFINSGVFRSKKLGEKALAQNFLENLI